MILRTLWHEVYTLMADCAGWPLTLRESGSVIWETAELNLALSREDWQDSLALLGFRDKCLKRVCLCIYTEGKSQHLLGPILDDFRGC